MFAVSREYQTVAELMDQRAIDAEQLERCTGIERRILEAIAQLRYTPSPQQRDRVSHALGFPRSRLIWGHLAVMDDSAYLRS